MLSALHERSTSSPPDADEDVDVKSSIDGSVNTVGTMHSCNSPFAGTFFLQVHIAQNLVEPVLEAARQCANVIVGYVVKR